jgi:hypothetical protein
MCGGYFGWLFSKRKTYIESNCRGLSLLPVNSLRLKREQVNRNRVRDQTKYVSGLEVRCSVSVLLDWWYGRRKSLTGNLLPYAKCFRDCRALETTQQTRPQMGIEALGLFWLTLPPPSVQEGLAMRAMYKDSLWQCGHRDTLRR